MYGQYAKFDGTPLAAVWLQGMTLVGAKSNESVAYLFAVGMFWNSKMLGVVTEPRLVSVLIDRRAKLNTCHAAAVVGT